MIYSRKELIDKLYHYEDVAYDHHIFETVLSDPVDVFENIMHQAAYMLEKDTCPNCGAKMRGDENVSE